MLVVVAIFLAVALDPAVQWVERRRGSRWAAAALVSDVALPVLAGFVLLAGASLVEQGRVLVRNLTQMEQTLTARVLPVVWSLLGREPGDIKPVAGNVATSVFATAFALVLLWLLKVPAPRLLAPLAGVFDFVPVLGFVISGAPGVLVASTVSIGTAAAVLAALPLAATYPAVERIWLRERLGADVVEEHRAVERRD